MLLVTLSAGLAFLGEARAALSGMGLKDTVTKALAGNPGLKGAVEKINQADSQSPVDRANLLPTLSANATAEQKKDAITSSSVRFGGESYNSFEAGVSVSQKLFVYGGFSALSASKKEIELRKIEAGISARDLVGTVVLAYFQAVVEMRKLESLKRWEKLVIEALATAERRARIGRGQRLDVLQVKSQHALLKSQIKDAESKVQIAGATLANLIGDKKSTSLSVRNTLEAPELAAIDREVKLDSANLPELTKNRIAIEQIGDRKSASLGRHLPSLSASGNYSYASFKQADLFKDFSSSWAMGLTVTIPLFSGFSANHEQQVLNSQRLQLEYERAAIENSAGLLQVSSRKKLEVAEQAITQGKEALQLAKSALDEAKSQYGYYLIDFDKFLNVQKTYIEADSAFHTFKFDYLSALTNYFVASGQDMGRLVEILERLNR